MKPLQAAKAHCANYQNEDGSCLGIAFRDDLSMYRFRAPGLCVFKQATCQACPYFEQIVLPQVPASVAEEYRKSLPACIATIIRPQHSAKKVCLDCRKSEVRQRQKYCPACARNRKRAANRDHIRQKRGHDVGKVEISPLRAEALTKPEMQGGYLYPKTSILQSSFSTQQGSARRAPARADFTPNSR